jgi:hypothetical protein
MNEKAPGCDYDKGNIYVVICFTDILYDEPSHGGDL